MARPRKTLLERVLENSFRAGRYAVLLAQPLPSRSPFGGRLQRKLWQELHAIQRRAGEEPEYLDLHARDFGSIVCALHGRPPPRWYREGYERRVRVFLARFGFTPREPLPAAVCELDAVLRLLQTPS